MGAINDLENKYEEVKAEMCDKYCKMPDQYTPEEWDKVCQDVCGNCPLGKL